MNVKVQGRAQGARGMDDAELAQMMKDRLMLMKECLKTTHIISCPYDAPAGVAKAAEIAERYNKPPAEYCYYPNKHAPQSLDVSWLKTWQDIAKNTKKTGGKVFVIHRTDGKGRFGCDQKGPGSLAGSLDGQAQEG